MRTTNKKLTGKVPRKPSIGSRRRETKASPSLQRSSKGTRGANNTALVTNSLNDWQARLEAQVDVSLEVEEKFEAARCPSQIGSIVPTPLCLPTILKIASPEDDAVGDYPSVIQPSETSWLSWAIGFDPYATNWFDYMREWWGADRDEYWLPFSEMVRCHFVQCGYTESSLSLAKVRMIQWMSRIPGDRPPGWSKMAPTIVVRIYYERWTPSCLTTWLVFLATNHMRNACELVLWQIVGLFDTVYKKILLFVLFLALLPWFIIPCILAVLPFLLILICSPFGYLIYWYCTRIGWQDDDIGLLMPTELRTSYIEDWCCGEFSDARIDCYARIRAPPDFQKNYDCKARKYAVGFTFMGDELWCSRNCVHNEWCSLVKRQLLPALSSADRRKAAWQHAFVSFTLCWPKKDYQFSGGPETLLDNFVSRYPVRRRDTILRDLSMHRSGLHYLNVKTKLFVKKEWNLNKVENKRAPRAISSKSGDFLAESAPIYYDWFKDLSRFMWPDVETAITRKFIYTGGFNNLQLGSMLHTLEMHGYQAFPGDYVKYDAHNEREAIEAELDFYKMSMPTEFVDEVLREFLQTKGVTMHGITYSHDGKVNSGGCNTSGGNTIRGFMMCCSYCVHYNINDWVVMENGDDFILFVKGDGLGFVKTTFEQWIEEFGHLVVLQQTADFDKIEFLSSRCWDVGSTRVMVPKLGRILAKTFMPCDVMLAVEDVPAYCREVAVGLLPYSWFPGISGLIANVLRSTDSINTTRRFMKQNPHKYQFEKPFNVDMNCVDAMFVKIYGVSPIVVDNLLRKFPIHFGSYYRHPLIDHILRVDGCND